MSEPEARVRAMVVYSNRRLGAAVELLVSAAVASALLAETAAAARPLAQGRWEHELVSWLEDRADHVPIDLDVDDIAWSPENFEQQQKFVVDAISRAATGSTNRRALDLWCKLVAAHRRQHVQVGRRWQWAADRRTAAQVNQ